MQFAELLFTSFKALNSNKIRSALTMLGVIIGVFAVITLISLGKGVQNFVTSSFNALGSNLLFVSPGRGGFSEDPGQTLSANKLADKHMDLIEKHASEHVVAATPSIRLAKTVEYKNKSYGASVVGSNEKAPNVLNFVVDEGKFFNKADIRSRGKVVIIGQEVKQELFPNTNPLGEKIKMNGESFEVIGYLKKKNSQFDGSVIAPYTTIQTLYDIKNFSSIGVKVKDENLLREATLHVELALRRDLKEDDFSVLSQQEILDSINSILNILTISVSGIAGISLLVGGIGIMNIMLVSVTERIREIGLRKAVGASSKDIAYQFLSESILLSFGGGFIGLLLSYLVTLIVKNFIEAEVTPFAVLLAFSFSVVVGVVFGTYPAIMASKKDPIESLRYE